MFKKDQTIKRMVDCLKLVDLPRELNKVIKKLYGNYSGTNLNNFRRDIFPCLSSICIIQSKMQLSKKRLKKILNPRWRIHIKDSYHFEPTKKAHYIIKIDYKKLGLLWYKANLKFIEQINQKRWHSKEIKEILKKLSQDNFFIDFVKRYFLNVVSPKNFDFEKILGEQFIASLLQTTVFNKSSGMNVPESSCSFLPELIKYRRILSNLNWQPKQQRDFDLALLSYSSSQVFEYQK